MSTNRNHIHLLCSTKIDDHEDHSNVYSITLRQANSFPEVSNRTVESRFRHDLNTLVELTTESHMKAIEAIRQKRALLSREVAFD